MSEGRNEPNAGRGPEGSRSASIRARELLSRRPVTGAVAAFAIGILISAAIGAAVASSKSSQIDGLNDRLARKDGDLVRAQEARELAQRKADAITDRRDDIIRGARASAGRIEARAKHRLAKTNGKLDRVKGELDSTRDKLDRVDASLDSARKTRRLSSFGDGIWESGTDFLPGTYRTEGGKGCYWATLNSADTFDIADNENGVGPQIVDITTPYFQSEDCGTWKRTGG